MLYIVLTSETLKEGLFSVTKQFSTTFGCIPHIEKMTSTIIPMGASEIKNILSIFCFKDKVLHSSSEPEPALMVPDSNARKIKTKKTIIVIGISMIPAKITPVFFQADSLAHR